MSSNILTKLKILETLYLQGQTNDAIEKTLDKIIKEELAMCEQKNAELEADIRKIEQEYQMSSAEFYQRFHAGELGDEIDFVEWNAFYQMWQEIQKQIQLLQSTQN